MHLLVVGVNGLLGSNVVRAGQERDWTVAGTYYSTEPEFDITLTQFDLENYETFDELLNEQDPDLVVNCAAMTDVDRCERSPERAHTVNGDAPGAFAERCRERGTEFVHVSTDYVFDGTRREPYGESAETNPVQVYGDSKLAGERAVRDVAENTLIARLSFVWGIHRGSDDLIGFPAWVWDQLQSGENVPLFTDQWISPSRAGQTAETLLGLVEEAARGYYHIACRTCATPYEFGEILAGRVEGGTELLDEGAKSDVEREATRPAYTCLNVEKVESALGRSQPTLREDVEAVQDSL